MATICPFYQNKYQSGWAICIQFSPLFLEVSRLCIAATDKRSAAEHTAAVARLDIYNCNWDLPPPPPPPAETWKSTQVWRLLVAANMDGLGWLGPRYLNGTDTTKTRFSFQKRPSSRPPRPLAQYITRPVKITPKSSRPSDGDHYTLSWLLVFHISSLAFFSRVSITLLLALVQHRPCGPCISE